MNENTSWNNYIRSRCEVYETIQPNNLEHNLISEANWIIRSRCTSCNDLGITVRTGDI